MSTEQPKAAPHPVIVNISLKTRIWSIYLLPLSSLLPLPPPPGTFLNTTSYAADGLPHSCKHKAYLEDSVGSPPASKTPPLITWTWENNAVIYLLLCTLSSACPWFPAGRRGEGEREEMLKYRLGYKPQLPALLPHTPHVPRGTGFVLGRKRSEKPNHCIHTDL